MLNKTKRGTQKHSRVNGEYLTHTTTREYICMFGRVHAHSLRDTWCVQTSVLESSHIRSGSRFRSILSNRIVSRISVWVDPLDLQCVANPLSYAFFHPMSNTCSRLHQPRSTSGHLTCICASCSTQIHRNFHNFFYFLRFFLIFFYITLINLVVEF